MATPSASPPASLLHLFSERLYLRIWLAVVSVVAILTLLVGWAWRIAAEHHLQNTTPATRDFVLHDGQGAFVGRGVSQRLPGQTPTFQLQLDNGPTYRLEMSAPKGEAYPPPHANEKSVAFWLRPPLGFVWMLGVVGIAVALGAFPVVRRLLKRLEVLQSSVQSFGEGDLSIRVPVQGHDEVADLSRQFNAAACRIQSLVQSHKSLLANASHELRSPLTRIRMGLELMGTGQPAPAFRAEILHNIAELDQLVDEILLASRLDALEADIGTVESVDLVGLAAEECARVGADLDAGSSELEVAAVAKLLRRALRNLLENARRYSQGDITVVLHRSGNMAEVHVCDQGPGVPEALRERIFEPFFRLPGASERAGGVGLGLALVRSIAARHHGSVHCQAGGSAGGGAVFVLCLPLQIPAPAALAGAQSAG